MLNVFRPSWVRSVLLCLLVTMAGSTAKAQATSQNPGLDRQLSRIDLGVQGVGMFNRTVSGPLSPAVKWRWMTSSPRTLPADDGKSPVGRKLVLICKPRMARPTSGTIAPIITRWGR